MVSKVSKLTIDFRLPALAQAWPALAPDGIPAAVPLAESIRILNELP